MSTEYYKNHKNHAVTAKNITFTEDAIIKIVLNELFMELTQQTKNSLDEGVEGPKSAVFILQSSKDFTIL